MKSQIVDAPTKLIAIGRKISDFEIFSAVGFSRSDSTATYRHIATAPAGTTMIHSRLLISALCRAGSVNR
jgi:hypothetical protein